MFCVMAEVKSESFKSTESVQEPARSKPALTSEDAEKSEVSECVQRARARQRPGSAPELLATALLALALDAGFEATPHEEWKSLSVTYSFQIDMKDYAESSLKIEALTVDKDVMLVIGTLADPLVAYSMCLRMKDYTTEDLEIKNVLELRFKFRDRVLAPLRSATVAATRAASASLLGLPREVLLRVLRYAGPEAVTRAARVCTALRDIVAEPSLWRCFYLSRYGTSMGVPDVVKPEQPNWYKVFQLALERDRIRMRTIPHPLPNAMLPFNPLVRQLRRNYDGVM